MGTISLGDATRLALGGMRPRKNPTHSWAPRQERAPVRSGSLEAGSFEKGFFTVPAKGETDHLLRVARRTLDAGRRLRRDARSGVRRLSAAERTIAALTSAAVRVYEELLTLARLNQGRVFPTYDHLAHATGLGRATVARALPLLEAIGFLARQRRFKRLAGHDGATRYAQTSNVYRVLLPARVLDYLPRWMRPAPLPDDEARRRIDQSNRYDAMLAGLTCHEFAQATVSGSLGQVLANLGTALDRRGCESQNDPQTTPQTYKTDVRR